MKKILLAILAILLFSLVPVNATQHTCSGGPVGNLNIISPITTPSSFAPGETFNVDATVENGGLGIINDVILRAFLRNENTNSEIAIGFSSTKDLAGGASDSFNVNLIAPSANVPITDSYKIYFKAFENSNPGVNCAEHNVAISSRSDLTVAVSNPSNGDPLETVSGSIDISSFGSTIPVVNLVAKDFVSGSNVIPASVVTLGTTSLTNVQSGSPQTVPVTINIPASQAPGLYSGNIEVSDGADTKIATLQFSVNSNSQFDVTEAAVIISGDDDSIRTRDISIKNNGNTLLTNFNFVFTQSVFSDNGKDILLSFADPGSLTPGQQKFVTISVDIPSGVDEDDYTGTITVNSGAISDTFSLTIRVQPELCEEGEIGNLLRITDVDIDDEDLELGDILEFDIEVTNDDDDDDIKVTVEAFLWNDNEKTRVGDDVKESKKIDEDDDDVFSFEIEIPEFEEDDIGEDDDYTLFIKAYEKGDEDKQCVEETERSITIEREEDPDVRVKTAIALPSTVSCGDNIDFRVTVQNTGTEDDDDVYVKVVEETLGLDVRSERFDLDEYDDSDNDNTVIVSFTVPDDAQEGSYQAEVLSVYDNGRGRDDEFVTFSVTNCDGTSTVDDDDSLDDGTDTRDNIVGVGTDDNGQPDDDGRSRTVEFRPVGFFDSIDGKTVFWIIGDIVLILIAVLFIKLIFTPAKPKV